MKHRGYSLHCVKIVLSIGLFLAFAKIAHADLFPLPQKIKAEVAACGAQVQAVVDHRHLHRTIDPKKCPLSATFLHWSYYTSGRGSVTFDEVSKFIDQHPDWPSQKPLQRRAEEALTEGDEPLAKKWFKKHPPLTGKGWVYYIRTLPAKEKKAAIVKAWRENAFTPDGQAFFLKEFKDELTAAHHFDRCEFLILQDKPDQARSLLPLMESHQRKIIKICLNIAKRKKTPLIKQTFDPLEAPCIISTQIRWYTDHKKNNEAIALLRAFPYHTKPSYQEALWRDRNLLTRRLFEEKKYNEAYALIQKHKLILKGDAFATAEWTAGWLSLRYLNKPQRAREHFQKLYNNVQSPISKARAAFWLGETETALKKPKEAQKWYRLAKAHPTAFYGQLAASRLNEKPPAIIFQLLTEKHPVLAKFRKRPEVQIIQLLRAIKQKNHIMPFLLSLCFEVKDPKEQELLVEFAAKHGNTYTGVWVCIHSTKTRVPLVPAAYPTLKKTHIPRFAPLVLTFIRQESRFNSKGQSSKNAQGIMQVLPTTAREIERQHRLKPGSLLDPAHNIRVGSKFLEGLIHSFSGNFILVAAAYNAGSGTVERWIKEMGDPRDPTVDPIEWIEQIPYGETRNYVQRVIETYLVYRARLDLPPMDIKKILHGQRVDA